MTAKIRAAVDAQTDADFVVIARTDAVAVEGFDAALERAERDREAGADVLFVEAPNAEQLPQIASRLKAPLLYNMATSGKTPFLGRDEIERLGFKLIIYPNWVMLARCPLARSAGTIATSPARSGFKVLRPARHAGSGLEGAHNVMRPDAGALLARPAPGGRCPSPSPGAAKEVNLVVDFRAYTLKPGTAAAFLELFEREGFEPQQRILGNFMGLYRTEFGDINQIVMMFGYADAGDRERRRAALYDDPASRRTEEGARAHRRAGSAAPAAPCNPRIEGVVGAATWRVLPAASAVRYSVRSRSARARAADGGARRAQAGAGAVLERDAKPASGTALSTGLIPAAATRFQRALGIEDSPALLASDIWRKARGATDRAIVDAVARASGPTIEWLADRHGVAFKLVEGFLYPGHSVLRMHGTPHRTGEELESALLAAAGRLGIDIVSARSRPTSHGERPRRRRRFRPSRGATRPSAATRSARCCGFGGNKEIVREHIPRSPTRILGPRRQQGRRDQVGHRARRGRRRPRQLPGPRRVATPRQPGQLGLLTNGGYQVNALSERFSNEVRGYSVRRSR
jgi:hypothetical protein